jgi:hypothetical protein
MASVRQEMLLQLPSADVIKIGHFKTSYCIPGDCFAFHESEEFIPD